MTPRDYMRLSIEVMKKSIQEPRTDGKVSPLVGAVLVMPNGEYITAYRGELRKGDHAEYTAIERKSADKNLTGATLYATLEPCAPESRQFPKSGCSKRITNARIKKVYVGIEDPDPTVCGLGLKHLMDNGVEVKMYPEELQAEIIACNEEFLRQAKDRAKEAKEKEEKQFLTEIEKVTPNVELDDLDEGLLNQFKLSCKIIGDLHSASVIRSFVQLGILADNNGKTVPTGVGLLLFGKNPQLAYPNALIRATIKRGKMEDVQTFEGPLLKQPEQIIKWVEKELTSWISRKQAKREKVYEYPLDAIREIIVNAILHRDYSLEGAPIYVEINEDAIVVKSPGYPVRPLTLQQIKTFSAPSLSRNPKIIYVFDKFDLAEQRGLGFKTVRALPTQDIPLPKVIFEEPYLIITMPFKYSDKKNNDEDTAWERGIDFAKTHDLFSKQEYSEALSLPLRTAERQLQQLTKQNILVKEGAGPSTKYKYNSNR